jgi:glucose-6-phosphate 1-dehydrogenase
VPDLRQGCATGKSAEDTAPADALVLFGVMGDLAHKKIFPALYHMVQHGHLDVPVIGVARAGRTNEHLKERVRDSIQQQGGEIDQEALAKLLKLLRYVGGDYEKAGTFDLLKKTLGSASRRRIIWQFHPISLQASSNLSQNRAASTIRESLSRSPLDTILLRPRS